MMISAREITKRLTAFNIWARDISFDPMDGSVEIQGRAANREFAVFRLRAAADLDEVIEAARIFFFSRTEVLDETILSDGRKLPV